MPDLDKLVRAVLDALTGVCYKDDSQVVYIETEKVWDKTTYVGIWQIEKQNNAKQATIWAPNGERLGAKTPYRT